MSDLNEDECSTKFLFTFAMAGSLLYQSISLTVINLDFYLKMSHFVLEKQLLDPISLTITNLDFDLKMGHFVLEKALFCQNKVKGPC